MCDNCCWRLSVRTRIWYCVFMYGLSLFRMQYFYWLVRRYFSFIHINHCNELFQDTHETNWQCTSSLHKHWTNWFWSSENAYECIHFSSNYLLSWKLLISLFLSFLFSVLFRVSLDVLLWFYFENTIFEFLRLASFSASFLLNFFFNWYIYFCLSLSNCQQYLNL